MLHTCDSIGKGVTYYELKGRSEILNVVDIRKFSSSSGTNLEFDCLKLKIGKNVLRYQREIDNYQVHLISIPGIF